MRNYLLFRLLITVLGFLLVTFHLSQLAPESKETTCIFLYSLLGLYLAVGVVSLLTFSAWKERWGFSRQQVLLDFVFQGMLIWSTGGVVSIFCPILFVTLAAGTGVSSPGGSYLLATLSSILMGGATLAYSLGLLSAGSSWAAGVFANGNGRFVFIYLFASIVVLYTIASLGSKLSSGLRYAEHLQKEILESIGEGLLAIDRDGVIILLNEELRQMLGLSGTGTSYSQTPFRDVLRAGRSGPSPDAEARTRLLEAFSMTGRRRLEVALADPSGRLRPIEVKISSILDDEKRLRCRVGLFSDLTLKREIAAAEQRIQKLEELHEMAMGIAHEIRNPLASVRGCVQEIARLSRTDLRQAKYAEIVLRESDRLDRIIEDFLRYSRSAPPDLVPLDLVAVISEAVSLLGSRPDIGGRSIEWNPPEASLRVYGDRDRLLQVFLNVGINALQATDPQKGQISVMVRQGAYREIQSAVRGKYEEESVQGVEVIIRDNGEGIDKSSVGKVFTPFYTTKSRGTGLGLSVVDRIIREHLGHVEILPEMDGGTRVRVLLPAFEARREIVPGPGCPAVSGRQVEAAVHV
ncbi:MAG: PAS domain-containing protein [Planctomycetes bacterium]|nr:PAS domain-containing protein [Planctomycetota bacterium]